MLVLARKPEESIVITGPARLTVIRVDGQQVKLGLEGPESTRFIRAELVKDPDTHGGQDERAA